MSIIRIIEIDNNELKQKICEEVLKDLPEWFGIDEATAYYIKEVAKYPFIAVYTDNKAIGFYSLREENKDTLSFQRVPLPPPPEGTFSLYRCGDH